MPSLPTLTIADQVVWDRVYAAFKGDPAEYKAWLVKALTNEVERREVDVIQRKASDDMTTRAQEISTLLQGKVT